MRNNHFDLRLPDGDMQGSDVIAGGVTSLGKRRPRLVDVSELFTGDGAKRLEEASGVEIWAEIPFDPRFGAATDSGTPLVITDPDAQSSRAIFALADRVASS